MKRPAQKILVLTVSILSIILISGCEEQNLSDTKKHRLIAVENTQLKSEVAELKKEIELRDEKIQEQKELLDKNHQEKKYLRTQATEKLRDRMDYIVESLSKENKLLRGENEEFKLKIQQLEARVQQLEKEIEQIKKPSPEPLSPNP